MVFFKSRNAAEAPAAQQAESVEILRARAKHRLIGAVFLVLAGVIGFPLLFDSQPRPVPVDIQIDMPDRTRVAPLQIPAADGGTPAHGAAAEPVKPAAPAVAAAPAAPAVAPVAKPIGGASAGNPPGASRTAGAAREVAAAASLDASEQIVSSQPQKSATKTAEPAVTKASSAIKSEAKPTPAAPATAAAPARAESRAEARPAAKPEVKAETSKPETKPEAKPTEARAEAKSATNANKPDDGARAKALLEGRTPDKPDAAAASEQRFIIQVGAFAENDKAHDARVKLERAGLKTYVHVADTKDGRRIRVRVGPFATRAEAEKVAGKVKTLQLPAAILIL